LLWVRIMKLNSYRRCRPGGDHSKVNEESIDPSFRRARTGTLIKRPGRRVLQVAGLRLALQLAVLTILFFAAGRADAAVVAKSAVEAKLAYCQDCHGLTGQGYRGFFAIPRLAGQQVEYLENQLHAFVEGRRPNPIMSNVAHVLSPSMITALAEKFRDFNPGPLGGAPKDLIAKGQKIFQEGVPDANVAACAACHGPKALGYEQIPRLAGQLYPYLIKELTNWSKERGQNPAKPDTSFIMAPVAHSLTRPQVEAVAAYLSDLK
jgi:cytochrome c553